MGGIAAQRGLPLISFTTKKYIVGYADVLAGASVPALRFGNLNNGSGNAGLSYLNANNDLSNSRWNYLGRHSELI